MSGVRALLERVADEAPLYVRREDRPPRPRLEVGDLRRALRDYLAGRDDQAPAWPIPWPHLRRATDGGIRPGELWIVAGWTSHAKALDVETPLATTDGWKTMGTIEVGDRVFAPDGSPTRVEWVGPVLFERPCLRLLFRDGAELVADADHRWEVSTHGARVAAQQIAAGQQASTRNGKRVVTTAELAALVRNERRPVAIDCAQAPDWPEASLPVGPYTLGVWLGDGNSVHPVITMHRDDAEHVAPRIANEERDHCVVRMRPIGGKDHLALIAPVLRRDVCRRGHTTGRDAYGHCPTCRRVGQAQGQWTVRALGERLRELGVLGAKHIPERYLLASPEQRLSLLQGLMDTDGTVHRQRSGRSIICLSNRRLADDVYRLVVSLGIKATRGVRRTSARDSYSISFSTATPVFSLPRKRVLLPEAGQKMRLRYLRAVEPTSTRPVRCIGVAHPSRLFCAGVELIPTHNSVVADHLLDSAAGAGARCHLYMTEMTIVQRGLRALARRTGVLDAGALRRRRLDETQLALAEDAIARLPYGISVVRDWTPRQVALDIVSSRTQVAVVDHLHDFHYRDEREIAAHVGQFTAAIGSDAAGLHGGSAVVLLCQLNETQMRDSRSGQLPRPGLHSIKGASAIKQKADVVLFTWLETDEDGLPDEREPGLIGGELWIAKGRNGGAGGRQRVQLDTSTLTMKERLL